MANPMNVTDAKKPETFKYVVTPRYVAVRKAVMCGQNCACVACSHEMAKKIARLLNEEEGK